MLYGQGHIFLREVEHVEDTVLLAAVLAVVDGTYHLYDGLALMHHLRLAILSDDGQASPSCTTFVLPSCPMMVSSPCTSTP